MDNRLNTQKRSAKLSSANEKRILERKRKLRQYYAICAVIFLFFFLIVFSIVYIGVRISLRGQDRPDKITYIFNTVNGENTELFEKKEYLVKNVKKYGEFYVCLDQISDICKFRYINDGHFVSLTNSAGNDTISFRIGSQNCSVNGTNVELSAPCVEIGKEVYVPFDVFEEYFSPLSGSFDSENSVFTVSFSADSENGKFSVREIHRIKAVSQNGTDIDAKPNGKSVAEISFKADLSKFEDYMNPYDSSEYLVLVNANHALAPTYVPSNLEKINDSNIPINVTLRLNAQKSLEAMLKEARANGYNTLTVTDAYKDYGSLNSDFNGEVNRLMNSDSKLTKEDAESKVLTYLQRAGTNEFQTGLSCIIINYGKSKNVFGESVEAAWLAENCWKFGYIVRYTDDKSDITGVKGRAYQFRYVGRYHAEKMKASGLCLEEYIKTVDSYK